MNCKICGKNIDANAVFQYQEPYYTLCPECARNFYTCLSCAQGLICKFKENPDHLQPVIVQTIRQGNMIVQQQTINPELVARTCKAGCKCWHEESKTCLRQCGVCIQYELAPEYKGEASNGQ